MTLSDLFIVCSHGRRSAHGDDAGGWCQGGRPVTKEELIEILRTFALVDEFDALSPQESLEADSV